MTRDDVIRMAKESGWTSCANDIYPPLERFAALVAAHEREACAKVCDELSGNHKLSNYYAFAAAAIRARGDV